MAKEKGRPVGLKLRRLADRSDPSALEAELPGAPEGTWPLAGVEHVGDAPARTMISTRLVEQGQSEGWVVAEGSTVVVRPGGPAADPWRKDEARKIPHVFQHCDVLVIAGVRYKVVHQPDKYAADGDDNTPVTDEVYTAGATRVDHFYGLEREA